MKWIIIALPLMLAACQHTEQVAEPVIVKVPVAVPCSVKAIAEPQWNVARLMAGASSTAELQAVLADLDLSKGYIEELKAELKACS